MPGGAGEVVGTGLDEAAGGAVEDVVVDAGRQAVGNNETAISTATVTDRENTLDINTRRSGLPIYQGVHEYIIHCGGTG